MCVMRWLVSSPRCSMIRWLLSLLLVLTVVFVGLAWQIIFYGNQSIEAQADAAIILGAAAWGNRPSPIYRERINQAIFLYKAGRVKYLVFTGGTPEFGYPSEAQVGREFAIKHGIPKCVIFTESTSRTTWQNLENAQKLIIPLGIKKVFLVSDPLHMRRAMTMASDMGFSAAPSPTFSSRIQSPLNWSKFLWRETWLYLGYLIFRNQS